MRPDSRFDLRESGFVDEMRHVSGDVSLHIAEKTEENHVGVDERVVICVGEPTRREEMEQIGERSDVER